MRQASRTGDVPIRATGFLGHRGAIPNASGKQDRGEFPDAPGADRLTAARGLFLPDDSARSDSHRSDFFSGPGQKDAMR